MTEEEILTKMAEFCARQVVACMFGGIEQLKQEMDEFYSRPDVIELLGRHQHFMKCQYVQNQCAWDRARWCFRVVWTQHEILKKQQAFAHAVEIVPELKVHLEEPGPLDTLTREQWETLTDEEAERLIRDLQ